MEKYEENSCYYKMTNKVGGQSMVPVVNEDIERNVYENTRKEGQNWDWSGMRKEK